MSSQEIARAVAETVANTACPDSNKEQKADAKPVQVTDDLWVTGAISDDGIRKYAKELGLKTLVNLRDGAEQGFRDEKDLAESLGLRFLHLPLLLSAISHQSMDKVLASLDGAPPPILVHCASMLRAAAVSVMHSVTRGQIAPQDVMKTAHDIGMDCSKRPELKEFVFSYIQQKLQHREKLPPITQVSPTLYIGPQATEEQLKDLAAKGVKSVLNLRSMTESGSLGMGVLEREKDIVEKLGMTYVNIPTQAEMPLNKAQRELVHKSLAELPQPVFVHCRTMRRTSSLLAGDTESADITKPLKGKPTVHCIPHADTATCTFVASCPDTKKAAIIDCVLDFDQPSGSVDFAHAKQVVEFVRKNGLEVLYCIETHAHADHLTAAPFMKRELGCKTAIGANIRQVQEIFGAKFNWDEKNMKKDGSQWDMLFEAGQVWKLGSIECVTISTPGHTPACMTWIIGDAAFTGDTIFMHDIGTARCDFPGGSADDMWDSVQTIFSLPEKTRLFVGHDYPTGGRPFRWETSITEQKRENKMVKDGTKKEDFVKMRQTRDAGLGAPRLLLPSIQVNIRGGEFPPAENNGVSYLKIPMAIKVAKPSAECGAAAPKQDEPKSAPGSTDKKDEKKKEAAGCS